MPDFFTTYDVPPFETVYDYLDYRRAKSVSRRLHQAGKSLATYARVQSKAHRRLYKRAVVRLRTWKECTL